jgi:hypothetical protein
LEFDVQMPDVQLWSVANFLKSWQRFDSLCNRGCAKDSCFALMQTIQSGYTPKVLLNVLNKG